MSDKQNDKFSGIYTDTILQTTWHNIIVLHAPPISQFFRFQFVIILVLTYDSFVT